MLKPVENAEKLYNSFINKPSEKDFFIGFSDYYSYLEKHQDLLASFSAEIEKLNTTDNDIKVAEQEALEEYKNIFEKVKKDITKNKYQTDELVIRKYQTIQDIFDGKIASSSPLLSNVYSELRDLVTYLLKKGKLEEIRKYAKLFDVNNPKPVDDFSFGFEKEDNSVVLLDKIIAPKLEVWRDKNKEKIREEKLSVWGLFSRVRDLYGMFTYCESEYQRLGTKKDATPSEKLHWLFLGTTVAEYNHLMTSRDSSRENVYFVKHKHQYDIERFHNFLVINYNEQSKPALQDKVENDFVYFDDTKNKLTYKDISVGLSRGSNICHTVKYIFSRNDIYEECFYDEIRDILDKSKNTSDKNIYDSLLQFNERLIKQGIKDLLIVNFHSVLINPKYKVKNLHDKTR